MRISASVSSIPSRDLPDIIRRMDQAGVDAFHLDSIESREAIQLARAIRPLSRRPMDLHLITSDPVKYWGDIRSRKIETINIQLERLHSPLFIPGDLEGHVGIAILANSPVEAFRPYYKKASSLLVMTTTPGYSGGTFLSSHFEKIARFRLAYPDIPMTVDGGVTPEIAAVLRMMGVAQIVSGSYLLNGISVEHSVKSLRETLFEEGMVKDIMVRRSHWPEDFHVVDKQERSATYASGERQWFINKRGELTQISKLLSDTLPVMLHEDLSLARLHNALLRLEADVSTVAVVNDLFQLTGMLTLAKPTL